ncbi:MAG: TolC family protein [Hyphomonas sp.]
MLSRRPDIAAQEARVEAAGLRAEQARLAMLPSLRFTASAGNTSTDIGDVFDPELIAARLIGGLTLPLFHGGRLDAQRDAAVAQAESAVANYASAALSAWSEVENALAADTLLATQEDAQSRSLEEAKLAEELAERQYTSGTITIFNLIDAQTRRITAESQLISVRSSRAANRISYHLALGGGLPVAAAAEAPLPADVAEE